MPFLTASLREIFKFVAQIFGQVNIINRNIRLYLYETPDPKSLAKPLLIKIELALILVNQLAPHWKNWNYRNWSVQLKTEGNG